MNTTDTAALLAALKAYRKRLVAAGQLLKASAVDRCILIIKMACK